MRSEDSVSNEDNHYSSRNLPRVTLYKRVPPLCIPTDGKVRTSVGSSRKPGCPRQETRPVLNHGPSTRSVTMYPVPYSQGSRIRVKFYKTGGIELYSLIVRRCAYVEKPNFWTDYDFTFGISLVCERTT